MFIHMLGGRGKGAVVSVGGGNGDSDGGFIDPPIVTTTASGNTTVTGKVKPGSFGKFVYPMASIAAGRQYTFRTTASFSQLSKQGKLAMVGFGVKNGNDFHLAGLRGDGSTGCTVYEVYGTPPNGWNKETGHTTADSGAPAHGTQYSAYHRLTTSADGTTADYATSDDGVAWTEELSDFALTPFTNVSGVATFGIALWFNNSDAGPFSILIDQFADAAAPTYLLDGLSPSGAWSMSRDLLTSFVGGSRYTGTSSASSFNDQTGQGSRNIAASPTNISVTTAGPNSRTCLHFDNVNQLMTGGVMSSLITATAGYLIASYAEWSASGSNNLVFGDGNTNFGIYLNSSKVNAYNQGAWAPGSGSGFAQGSLGTCHVVEWRHEGGNLYCRQDGGSWSAATGSGNTTLTGAINFGGKGGSGQAAINLFEAVSFSTIPATGVQDAVVANMKTWIGA